MYDPGEILLVPFQFTDLSNVKRRPVIVISNASFNSAADDVVVCAVTSQLKRGRHRVSIGASDLATGNLPKPSEAAVSKIATVDKTIVVKTLGSVTPAKLTEIRSRLRQLLSLP